MNKEDSDEEFVTHHPEFWRLCDLFLLIFHLSIVHILVDSCSRWPFLAVGLHASQARAQRLVLP